MAIPALIGGLATGIQTGVQRVEEVARNVITALINLFRQILDWIYALFYRFWNWISEEPFNAFHLMASIWVMMM